MGSSPVVSSIECTKCHEVKPTSEFGRWEKSSKRRAYWCKECHRANSNQRYAGSPERRRMIAEASARVHRRNREVMAWAKRHGCVDCGELDLDVLDFDHARGGKARNVSSMVETSVSTLLAEIAKCEVVCSNCHRVRTKKRAGLRAPEWVGFSLISLEEVERLWIIAGGSSKICACPTLST